MERALLGFDMLVTSGGASVGPHDLVRETQAAPRRGNLLGVAVKLGSWSPGVRRDHLVFNLPGTRSPVLVTSSSSSARQNALLGLPGRRPSAAGVLEVPVRRNAERDPVHPGAHAAGWGRRRSSSPSRQESHMIARAGRACPHRGRGRRRRAHRRVLRPLPPDLAIRRRPTRLRPHAWAERACDG
jgi:molybdopterin biosynthesis enzyme